MLDRELVLESAKTAQHLIRELHARDPESASSDQAGLGDGLEIVVGYLEANELGCALHHVLYMIHEADIEFPTEYALKLQALADRIGT